MGILLRIRSFRLLGKCVCYNPCLLLFIQQADKCAHGEGRIRRAVGAAAGHLLNRLPAAVEAALSRDATYPGTPYLSHDGASAAAASECAAASVPHLAMASAA
jgi:hypothetical protein